MEWALESSQDMVMLLLDFEKAYDKVEWGFLEGTLTKHGFNQTWIAWVRALYVDFKCVVGINKTLSDPFQLTRSIRQGCPWHLFFTFLSRIASVIY